jgi:very-short-patch-repair endonuclease
MDLLDWLTKRGGIAHRADAAARGFTPDRVRAAIRRGVVHRIRAQWIALPSAPVDLVAAAAASARLTCISLARRRGWWVPDGAASRLHLQVGPNAHKHRDDAVLHWAAPLVDRGSRTLTASVEDALAHLALCFEREDALTIWDSAIRVESLDLESLRTVRWPNDASRELAATARGLSDSGIETLFVVRLSSWGVPLRQQVILAGHRVDVVLGSHLVVQIDGFAHHSSAAERGRDVAHDAELRLRGYTVFRFTYAQIVHGWDRVEATISAAIARGLHLPPASRARRA